MFNSILLRNKNCWEDCRKGGAGCEGWTDFFCFLPFYTELNRKSRENIGAVRKAADKVSNSAGRFPSM